MRGSQPWCTSSTASCRSASSAAAIFSASGSGYPASIRTCRRQDSTFARSLPLRSARLCQPWCAMFVVQETFPACRLLAEGVSRPRRQRRGLVDAAVELGEAALRSPRARPPPRRRTRRACAAGRHPPRRPAPGTTRRARSRWRSKAACAWRCRCSSRCWPASPVWASRSAKTPSAWRTNVSTARSSSRESRTAASSRAERMVASNWTPAASAWRSASRAIARWSFSSWRRSMSANDASIRRAASVSAALDLLGQRLLAPAQPLGDLLDHAAALARVRLELLQRLGDRLLRSALELLAQARAPRRAARRRWSRARTASASIRASASAISCFCRCSSRRMLGLEVLLGAVEVVAASPAAAPRPGRVGRGERVGELDAGGALALDQLLAPLVGDPPLVLGEDRERVGAHAAPGAPSAPRRSPPSARRRAPRARSPRLRGRVAPAACARAASGGDREHERQCRERESDLVEHGSIVCEPALLLCCAMTLAEELERIAALAGADAVLAAEAQPGERVYVCAFEEGDGRPHVARARSATGAGRGAAARPRRGLDRRALRAGRGDRGGRRPRRAPLPARRAPRDREPARDRGGRGGSAGAAARARSAADARDTGPPRRDRRRDARARARARRRRARARRSQPR